MCHRRLPPQRRLKVEALEARRLLSASPLNPDSFGHDVLATNNLWLTTEMELTAPRVVSVRVSSQSWQSSFFDRIDPEQRTGFPMSALASQHASLPWINIDQVQIQFSEDVGANFESSFIKVNGTRIEDYQLLFSVNYNAESHVATLQFSEPLHEDKLQIGIDDTLSDADGNQLDGEWLDGGNQTKSGDGIAGGNFYYRIHVLAGDLSGDGVVLGNDVTGGVRSRGKTASDIAFDPRSDLDGSGDTSPEEINILVTLRGSSLPIGEPPLPNFPIAPLKSITTKPMDALPPSESLTKDHSAEASDLTNSDLTNSDLTNSDLTNSDLTNSDLTNSDLTNSDSTNGDSTNGDSTNGDSANGDSANDNSTDGDFTDINSTSDSTVSDLTNSTNITSNTVQPINGDVAAELDGAPFTCRKIQLTPPSSSEPLADILPLELETHVYGPLQPHEYRRRNMTAE